jgi:hypothetical protein
MGAAVGNFRGIFDWRIGIFGPIPSPAQLQCSHSLFFLTWPALYHGALTASFSCIHRCIYTYPPPPLSRQVSQQAHDHARRLRPEKLLHPELSRSPNGFLKPLPGPGGGFRSEMAVTKHFRK